MDRALLRVANTLTISRLCATPLLVYLLLETRQNPAYNWIALALLVVLLATDVLDGYIARRAAGRMRVNPTGEMLDPIADKLYLNSAFITLAVLGRIEVWVAGLIVTRDVLILLAWLWCYVRSRVRALPNAFGKLANFSQAVLVFAILIAPPAAVLEALVGVTCVLTVLSGLSYAWVSLLSNPPART